MSFSSKLHWGSYIVSHVKTAFKKIKALIFSMKFFSPEADLPINISSGLAWNTVFISRLVVLDATWIR